MWTWICKYGIAIGLAGLLLSACASEEALLHSAEDKAVLTVRLRAASGAVNIDRTLWEDRVTEVRMIAFDTDGNAVVNTLLSFPNGFDNPCEAVQMDPGVYDFYFLANETACGSAFATAAANITNKIQFQSDAAFYSIAYDASFAPDSLSSAGRFLMSAAYEDLKVISGGTRLSPLPLALPEGKVELIRSLAKVEVVFYKKTPGSSLPDGTIGSVRLHKLAANYAVPPTDLYYAGTGVSSQEVAPNHFDYSRDSLGAVVFYVPELLRPAGSGDFTELHIDEHIFPIRSQAAQSGLDAQRRRIQALSDSSVIRNYHYHIEAYVNTQGGLQLKICVNPWNVDSYKFVFQDTLSIGIPPVVPTDSSVIVPTDCGKIEIRSNNEYLPNGLQGAYGDQINWWNPVLQGPEIIKGSPPYYCEKKYGPGWRLISSCELLSFLALFDKTYKIWHSNTWQAVNSGLPFYPLPLRQEAQTLLGKLTGTDMSQYHLSDSGKDNIGSEKLNMLDNYFTPGDIMVKENDYPYGWPFPSPSATTDKWFPQEVILQVKGYWYAGYLDYTDPDNTDAILYHEFTRYSFSSTVSRCVRNVE